MHIARHQARSRVSLSTLFMVLMLVSVILYIFYVKLSNFDREASRDRCLSELNNVKDQLASVLEYKGKMDTLMAELQKECKLQKDNLQEFYNNYMLVKQHLDYCEMQTDDLEIELTTCKKTPG